MKYFIVVLIVLATSIFVYQRTSENPEALREIISVPQKVESEKVKVIAQDFDTPWAIVFLPSGNLLVTERKGIVSEVDVKTGSRISQTTLTQVKEIGEGGLLGLDLDPEFTKNSFVYLYYTYSGNDTETKNKVVRMTYKNSKLENEQTIINEIPGAANHNGGRIKFGPDRNLYITTGDAQVESLAQDTGNFAGKILRVVNGIPEIYSYGHRNPQGLVWDSDGQLWSTEHGRSGALSGFDELNKVDQGKNYGWPVIQGDDTKEGMEKPAANSGATTTWAPAGLAFTNGKLYFGGLRGAALYAYDIAANKLTEHFKGEFGRIRGVAVGPDKMLYITTSNLDGRGNPKDHDDKIIRLDPTSL